ncbi:hypothetical protein LRAMOSA08716 [Lichtheimia ramosa]|uniref:DUF8032 domain-containing protein n=1 Tax=Lichtheimia ramosa TaxID=688394 RepID=A0A077WGJ6_9FUNG|nr:hypothetical protein LRAMOSA08716 [Lichtheimia ramosa]
MDDISLTLSDLLHAPDKAEQALEDLSAEQIAMIEQTIRRVKKRKLEQREDEEYTPRSVTRPRTTTKYNNVSRSEPVVEIRDGIEWVSFVYSHNRVVKRYSIRTDIQNVSLDSLDEQFKLDNCVYPRANLPKDTYRGNRWNYETECNRLGWKLAWLNKSEIAGKRGLIQRAVDSYRNRSPSMRSRRVARQAKLLNGTLRKRKQQQTHQESPPTPSASEAEEEEEDHCVFPTSLAAATVKSAHSPKTLILVDDTNNRIRIKINVDGVALDSIPLDFRQANTVFPRAVSSNHNDPQRYIEESICNELGWKLAWLNPRFLANKKTLLQRAMDMYRTKFMPAFQPRRRNTSPPSPSTETMSALPSSTASSTPSIQPSTPPPIETSVPHHSQHVIYSPSATESSFDEDLVLQHPNIVPDLLTANGLIDPCLMLSNPYIPPPPTLSDTTQLEEPWFKLEQDDYNISHYISYDNLF